VTGLEGWLIVGLGLGVIMVRRRSVAVGLVTVQALVLAVIALQRAGTSSDVVVAVALATRAAALGALFLFVVARSREQQPVRAHLTPPLRAGIAVVLILLLTGLVPATGLTSPGASHAVLALVGTGLACAATRRATLFQVLGIVLVENGLALAALMSPRSSSLIIELGVTLDLTLIAVVAALFHLRIVSELGSGDSAALRSLRD
jgi:hydrogenase-4 membrane subunit HyfE